MKTIQITKHSITLEVNGKQLIDEEKVSDALYQIMKANPEIGNTVNSACMMWLATFEVDEV